MEPKLFTKTDAVIAKATGDTPLISPKEKLEWIEQDIISRIEERDFDVYSEVFTKRPTRLKYVGVE